MSDMNCPYCNAAQEVCHDDGFGYAEDEMHQQECTECEKTFTFTTSIHFYYTPEKADCLNGEPHQWEPTSTYPIEYTKGRCKTCDLIRDATPEDMAAAKANRELVMQRVAAA